MSAELYAELVTFSDRKHISASQVASQGIRAIMDGKLELQPAIDPSVAGGVTRRTRGIVLYRGPTIIHKGDGISMKAHRMKQISEMLPARVADIVDVSRGLSASVVVKVSRELDEDIEAVAERTGRRMSAILDGAINEMIDKLEVTPWCRRCHESLEHCDCKVAVLCPMPAVSL